MAHPLDRVAAWLAGFPGGRRGGLAAAVLVLAAVAYTVATAPFGSDYARPDCGCDDPGPAISALAHGHFSQAARLQPLMGPVSIVARAPFAAVAYALGGDDYDAYKLGLIPCLLVLGGLAVFVVRALPDTRVNRVAAPIVAALFILNPGVSRAVYFGHPEELLTAALAVFAVIAALRQRPVLAGVILACAFATKQWAVLAIFVAIAVRPEQTVRLLKGLVLAGVVLYVPSLVGDAERFKGVWQHGGYQLETAAQGGSASIKPTNVWWPLTTYTGTQSNGVDTYALPGWVDHYSRFALIGAGIAVSAAYGLMHRRNPSGEVLLLLALVLLLRCLLDPYTNSYYNAGFIIALGAYEVYSRRRLPWVAVAAAASLGLTVRLADDLSADGLNRLYLAWTLALFAFMTAKLFMPDWSRTDQLGFRPYWISRSGR